MNSIKNTVLLVGGLLLLIVGASLSSKVFETNDAGYYQVKQAALTGNVSVRNDPGTYTQFFGNITTYQISDMYYFSKHDGDGEGALAEPIVVRFNDGGQAHISGALKFRLSTTETDQVLLHNDFKNYNSVKNDLIRQVVQEALNKTAAIMKAEESYSSRLAEFTTLAEEQIKIGIYETISKEVREKDYDGNSDSRSMTETIVSIALNKDGTKIVSKKSALARYRVEVINFVIKDFDFDEKTQAIIVKKKEAEQEKVVAKAKAERAKQDAITAAEEGKALVAKAEAEALVEKKTAVIGAEKDKEVAVQVRLKSEEESKAAVIKGRAEAETARLKVSAGLTPQEKADYQMRTAIGVAEQLSKVQFPSMMVTGGSGNGSAMNPFDAVGLESFIRINERMRGNKVEKE
jgi:regulator of protease activity HflC (stomatin/prohibitin superfamily)